ncbi:AMP-binding protein [Mycobacterium sp. NPDC050441]|uniref:AMP-binding protein n=1 Tax=Mycobacterium sp. NPDC050441 TaxID=3155403 RepID=UPI0033D382A9
MMLSDKAIRAVDEGRALLACLQAGALGPLPPSAAVTAVHAIRSFGTTGAIATVSALRHRELTALIDERGPLTYTEVDARSNAIANAWRSQGLRAEHCVGIMCRNHRGLLDAVFAAAKCGVRIVMLNYDFAGPQVAAVVEREEVDLLVHDDEYTDSVGGLDRFAFGRWRSWADDAGPDTLESLIETGDPGVVPAPGKHASVVILTSGTTGTPKGAQRPDPRSLTPMGGLLAKVPFRGREVTECCVPMFHALGFTHAILAVSFGSTLIIRRRFDARATLDSLARHRATAMIVAPIMLQRLLDTEPNPRQGHDLSHLRIIFVAGSQLGASLCRRAMQAFGPVLYNLYGSTEVAYATIATPDELRREPGSVGSIVRGARVEIRGDNGELLGPDETGRIFVANSFQFQGYTDGRTKNTINGLMASGDVGHLNSLGLLFIDGRDDDMIVSGGENIYPAEVEETLTAHPDIVEAAVIGIADDQFGQRLCAYVVPASGAHLTAQDIRDHVKANLARFKVPRHVVFLDELPRNPTGKIVKRALPSAEPGQRGDRVGRG